MRDKKLVIYAESHASAVSLLYKSDHLQQTTTTITTATATTTRPNHWNCLPSPQE